MRLLIDEMFPGALAHALRQLGFDVIAVDEHASLRGLSDRELLTEAAAEGRGVVTENVSDFMRLSGEWTEAGRDHAGIVIALSSRFSRTPAGHAALVAALAELCTERPEGDALRSGVHFLTRRSH